MLKFDIANAYLKQAELLFQFKYLNLVLFIRDSHMQKNIASILFLLIICIGLNSCGTKGPLYIPEKQYPQDTPTNK